MTEAKLVTFELRNRERRTYKDVTRVDDSRPHNVLVYHGDALIATLNKHDIITFTFEVPAREAAASAQTATES